jgi:hypothetical protein
MLTTALWLVSGIDLAAYDYFNALRIENINQHYLVNFIDVMNERYKSTSAYENYRYDFLTLLEYNGTIYETEGGRQTVDTAVKLMKNTHDQLVRNRLSEFGKIEYPHIDLEAIKANYNFICGVKVACVVATSAAIIIGCKYAQII